MSTALALVNRIRAKRRSGTSAIITDKEGVAFLDFLNSAITTVLEERTWNFQLRSDGALTTAAKGTFTGGLVVNGSITMAIGTLSMSSVAYINTDLQARVVITSDADFSNTSLLFDLMEGGTSALSCRLRSTWPGTTNVTTAAGYVYAYEYILPATVRSITSVRHQESDIALYFEDPQYTFDRLVPRPHDTFNDNPEFVMVGGEVQETAETGSASGSFGLCLRVFPVPESALSFSYSYVYRQPALTVSTSELNRVPPVIEDLIVDLATARVITSLEKDVQTGLPLESRILKNIDRVHRNHAADSGRRTPLKSLDHIGSPGVDPNWPPRTVAGLAGS